MELHAIKVSDYIVQYLAERGVRAVFELPGGMITHLLDSLNRDGRIQVVTMHHEQSAAFAVDAVGRLSGVPSVALATSGPGATNLITGIGSCYFDSSPAVFITGQVNRHEQKQDRPVRQLGFQETDIVSIVRSITKGAWLVQEADEIPQRLHEAFELAMSGRPGPVLLDIPMDIQRAMIVPVPHGSASPSHPVYEDSLDELIAALQTAERPLIIAGGGIRAAQARAVFRQAVDRLRVPVVKSLLAIDALPSDHAYNVGMLGSYGNRWSNLAFGRSDVVLVVGSRLDIRQTGADTQAFQHNRRFFHVDVDAGETNNRITGVSAIHAHLDPFLHALLAQLPTEGLAAKAAWLAEIADLKAEWPDTAELKMIQGINPNRFMHALSAVSQAAVAWVVDVGQHQMWAAQSLDIAPHQHFVTSGGMGSMGFALPAAIGAAVHLAPQPIMMIAGDGGFQCNIQELQTVVRNRLPIKLIVLNNQAHGMVRQFQQSYFEERYQSTVLGYDAPDFSRVAAAYGIPSRTLHAESEMADALDWLWQHPQESCLLQVMLDANTNVYPKIAFGHPLTMMEPLATPIAMEST